MQLDLFQAVPEMPKERVVLQQSPQPKPLGKRKINWKSINKDRSKFPCYSKTACYLIEHVSPTFERWVGLEEIEFIEA